MRDQLTEKGMTPDQFVKRLVAAYTKFSSSEVARSAACFCLTLDHWSHLRDQYGYSGLIALVGELRDLSVSALEVETFACALNERTVLMLIPECSVTSVADHAQKMFLRVNAQSFSIGQETAALSISLGYCEFDHRFTTADRLLVDLVDGTSEITAAGGNAVRKISPDVSAGQVSRSEQTVLELLMDSLRKESMRVLFQPLLATAAESSQSFQVLPRLLAADGSLVPAAIFVPVARKARILGVLDRWMIQRTVRLLTENYQSHPVRLFLSQGESLLEQPKRRDWLRRLIESHPEVSGKLVLDFVVEDALANLKSTAGFMRMAHELGIKICLSRVDEYSKWDLLASHLRADYIKMSPEFVFRLGQNSAVEEDFQRISAPIRKLGTKIIMPMVEDASAAANLWRIGADYMQGYMIERETETLMLAE